MVRWPRKNHSSGNRQGRCSAGCRADWVRAIPPSELDQGVVPALFPHIGDAQVDMRRRRARIQSDDAPKIVSRLSSKWPALQRFFALLEEGGRVIWGGGVWPSMRAAGKTPRNHSQGRSPLRREATAAEIPCKSSIAGNHSGCSLPALKSLDESYWQIDAEFVRCHTRFRRASAFTKTFS